MADRLHGWIKQRDVADPHTDRDACEHPRVAENKLGVAAGVILGVCLGVLAWTVIGFAFWR